MRPFFSRPQQLFAPFAIFVAMMYGMSPDAAAYELPTYPILASADITSFIRDLFSFKFADAREGLSKKPVYRPAYEEEIRQQQFVVATPELPVSTATPKVTTTPTPQKTPQETPAPTPRPTPSATATPTPTPAVVALVTPEPTPTPTPTPEQVALNFEPARKLIDDAVEAFTQSSGIEAFNLGKRARPYSYDGGKLSPGMTRRVYALAGLGGILGFAMLIRYYRSATLS